MILTILILVLGVVCFVLGVLNIKRMADEPTREKAATVASDFFVAGWEFCYVLSRLLG